MRYETERRHLVGVIEDLVRWEILNPAGGAVSVRLADGNTRTATTPVSRRAAISISTCLETLPVRRPLPTPTVDTEER